MTLTSINSFSNNTVIKIGELNNSNSSRGVAEKFLGKSKSNNEIGVIKFPIHKYSYDCINELVVYDLCCLFGIRCCVASKEVYNGKECIMSHFYKDGNFISCRKLINSNDLNKFNNLFNMKYLKDNVGDSAVSDFVKMIFIDYLTRQEDRHINNFGFIENRMYPLFDNGRCLFFEDLDDEIPSGNYDALNYLVNNEHGYGYAFLDLHLDLLKDLPKIVYDDLLEITSEYYNCHRAELLAKFIFNNYKALFI